MTLTESQHDLIKDVSVIITGDQLHQRVLQLGEEISRDYRGKDLVIICVLKGGIVFTSDLMRAVGIPHQLEIVGASSYKGGVSGGNVRITKDVDQDLANKHLLLIEDIYDSGNTLYVIHELLKLHRPASIEICALLYKQKEHLQRLPVRYTGFEIEDKFVVGYGLDYNELYRNLPCIGVLKPEIYS